MQSTAEIVTQLRGMKSALRGSRLTERMLQTATAGTATTNGWESIKNE